MNKEMMGLFTDSEVEEAQALSEVKFENENDNTIAGNWAGGAAAGGFAAAAAFV